MAGESIFVKSVAFVVRSRACSRNTYELTQMSDLTSASAAILPSKRKVGVGAVTRYQEQKRLKSNIRLILGNLTKHMKSKSHMKKCLELGVSPTAVDNTDDAGILFAILGSSAYFILYVSL